MASRKLECVAHAHPIIHSKLLDEGGAAGRVGAGVGVPNSHAFDSNSR